MLTQKAPGGAFCVVCSFVKDIGTANSRRHSLTKRQNEQLTKTCLDAETKELVIQIKHYFREFHPALISEFEACELSLAA